MQDIVITKKRIKKELFFLLISFVIALIMNVYAIISYNTRWIELLTTLHITIFLSVFLYFLIAVLRGLWWLIYFLYLKIKTKS